MIPFALLVAFAIPDSPPPDALRFGVSREIVALNVATCERHTERVVKTFSTDNAMFAWWYRQDAARDAWKAIGTAMDPGESNETRQTALKKLRWLIGDEAYNSGRLPSPVPNYGPWIPLKGGN